MRFIIYHLKLIVNPMGRILVRWKSFGKNLEMLCHPICNWLYMYKKAQKEVYTMQFRITRLLALSLTWDSAVLSV